MLIVTIKTLFDCTKTNANRTNGSLESKQQANLNTVIQCATLRSNMELLDVDSAIINLEDVEGFGTRYTNKQKVWTVRFENPYPDSVTIENLKQDFDLVPMINELEETTGIGTSLRTNNDAETNIIFSFA